MTFSDVAAAIELLPTASKGRLDLTTPPKQRLRGAVAYAAPLDLALDSDNIGASTQTKAEIHSPLGQ